MPPLSLLYIDRYHLDDPLFWQGFGRLWARSPRPPCVLVHGLGELADRLVEGAGYFPPRHDDMLVSEQPEVEVLVEQALRATTRRLAGWLTDGQVPAVALVGTDRGLLRREGERLEVRAPDWLAALAQAGGVPVLGARAQTARGGAPLPAAEAVAALAQALPGTQVVAFTRDGHPGVQGQEGAASALPAALVPPHAFSPPQPLGRLAEAAGSVWLTSLPAFLGPASSSAGTWVTAG